MQNVVCFVSDLPQQLKKKKEREQDLKHHFRIPKIRGSNIALLIPSFEMFSHQVLRSFSLLFYVAALIPFRGPIASGTKMTSTTIPMIFLRFDFHRFLKCLPSFVVLLKDS